MSVFVKENITSWITAYHKNGEDFSIDDMLIITDQIEVDCRGWDSWDYDTEGEGLNMIVVYKGI